MIDHHPLHFVILGTTTCPYCTKVAELIAERGHTSVKLLYDRANKAGNPLHTFLYESDLKTVPQVFINGWLLGGYEATESYLNSVSPHVPTEQGVSTAVYYSDKLRYRNSLDGDAYPSDNYHRNF